MILGETIVASFEVLKILGKEIILEQKKKKITEFLSVRILLKTEKKKNAAMPYFEFLIILFILVQKL